MKRPNSRRNLDRAIERLFGDDPGYIVARTIMADAIVAQMLPDGVVKGGSALKIRFGDAFTRFTSDLDTAKSSDMEEYAERLDMGLKTGWEGFAGTLVRRQSATPKGVPTVYIMQPFDVKLTYLEKPWVTVQLEVGHNEIGDADNPEMAIPQEASKMLQALGFPGLSPVPLIPLGYQVAQKLHGASEPGSKRAHDLVDLQLIVNRGVIDYGEIRQICERLFVYRSFQSWPPHIAKGEEWETLYFDAARGLEVLSSVDEAVKWANGLINDIASA